MRISQFKDILYEKEPETGIVTVTINRPDRNNAMSPLTFLELWWAVDHIENDEGALVMIITGAENGKNPKAQYFSAGKYLAPDALSGLDDKIINQIDTWDMAHKKLALKMWSLDKPVIAAVNGPAVGAGITMPICCADEIYLSDNACVQIPLYDPTTFPDFGITYLLPMLIGVVKARDVVFSGDRYTADDAFAMGMVKKVISHGRLMQEARQAALRLAPTFGDKPLIRKRKRTIQKQHIEKLTHALDLENEELNKVYVPHGH